MHAMNFSSPANLAASQALQGGLPFVGQVPAGHGGYSNAGGMTAHSASMQIAASRGTLYHKLQRLYCPCDCYWSSYMKFGWLVPRNARRLLRDCRGISTVSHVYFSMTKCF